VAMSLDLPTALKEWCGSHGIENIKAVSDYKDREFGMKTAFLMDEIFLLNRGIIILNNKNKIIYISRNENVHNQIDFNSLDSFLKTL
jgi:thiol peroxidase